MSASTYATMLADDERRLLQAAAHEASRRRLHFSRFRVFDAERAADGRGHSHFITLLAARCHDDSPDIASSIAAASSLICHHFRDSASPDGIFLRRFILKVSRLIAFPARHSTSCRQDFHQYRAISTLLLDTGRGWFSRHTREILRAEYYGHGRRARFSQPMAARRPRLFRGDSAFAS